MSKRDKDHGPVTDPLNVDWSAWQPAGMSREAIDLRIRRRTARARMQRFRSVPVKRRAWYVTLTATVADQEQDFDPHDLVAGLTFEPQAFWCLSRRKGRSLVERDKLAGGKGTMYPVEYRLCSVCGRQLLGPEAHDYRLKQLKPASTWQFPQGPACSEDCKPSGRGPGGEPMRYKSGRKSA
jgi:hypothetical protein